MELYDSGPNETLTRYLSRKIKKNLKSLENSVFRPKFEEGISLSQVRRFMASIIWLGGAVRILRCPFVREVSFMQTYSRWRNPGLILFLIWIGYLINNIVTCKSIARQNRQYTLSQQYSNSVFFVSVQLAHARWRWAPVL
jgi:hypothetical protein